MNNLDKKYQELLQDILDNGVEKYDRTGTGTISVFGRQIRHKMSEGFPILTTKKMAFKTMVTELLWFLSGSTRGDELTRQGCHIWDGDMFANYKKITEREITLNNAMSFHPHYGLSKEEFIELIKTNDEFAKKWGELGPIYGKQWRAWSSIDKEAFFNSDNLDEINRDARHGMFYKEIEIDQIQNLIDRLKTNPDSRRNRVNAWNVGELDSMVLPPCHTDFQVYTRELSEGERAKLYEQKTNVDTSFFPVLRETLNFHNIPTRAVSLMFNMRSNDVPLGFPFNISSYALLLEIIGRMVNMVPDEIITNLGDAHIYKNQVDGVKEQLTRTPMELPNLVMSNDLNFNGTIDEFLNSCNKDSFKLDGYKSHPSIKIPLSN